MRISILTTGSRGDVQPYIALGLGLKHAGHDVTLATHNIFADWITGNGLDFASVNGNPQEILNNELGQSWLETGQNPLSFIRKLITLTKPLVYQMAADFMSACENADLILYQVFASLSAVSIADVLNVPAYPAYLQPVHATSAYPNVMAITQLPLGGLYNQLSHKIGEQIFWQPMRPVVNQWRKDAFGLPPFSWAGPFPELHKSQIFCLYGFSPTVLPKPKDWPDAAHVTGYWFLENHQTWQPPDDLIDFLDAGTPPVYIGFGSMTHRSPEEVTNIALAALNKAGQRGLLLTGWGGLSNADLPDHIFKIESAPHDWLFPRMSAVIHHGGAGTTAAGLRAGIPSIVVPFFGDQPFWGWRVHQLGVGPKPIPKKQLSSERLTNAIVEAAHSIDMRQSAARLGEHIRAENGVTQAVEALNMMHDA